MYKLKKKTFKPLLIFNFLHGFLYKIENISCKKNELKYPDISTDVTN